LGTCWKQKLFPIVVFRLQREPAFVLPKHRFVELTPAVFLGLETIPNLCRCGGLQILQGDNPWLTAFSIIKEDETFFTIRQPDK
jgi:hypothetical protein